MATFAVGDVHGCFDSLERLLAKLPIDADSDRLWLVGDLVNRGPRSLDVLRWARRTAAAMGERFVAVLGNHDLHLLAYATGRRPKQPRDTLDEVVAAPDADELLAWLAARPLVHREEGWLLVHAGLHPAWDAGEAERRARGVEAALAGADRDALVDLDGKGHDPALRQMRADLSVFTRLRTCTVGGELCDHNGPPDSAPPGCLPWFDVPGRQSAGLPIVFGHWAALGRYQRPGLAALDSGCVWGNELTAVRLDDGEVFVQPAVESGPAVR